MVERTSLVCSNLTDITDELNELTSRLLVSSDFRIQTLFICEIALSVEKALKDTLDSIVSDVGDRLLLIAMNDHNFASEISEIQKALDDAHEKISGIKEVTYTCDGDNGSSTAISSKKSNISNELDSKIAEYMKNDPYYKKYANDLIAKGLMDENGNLAEGFFPLIQQEDFKGLTVPGGPDVGAGGCSLTSFCIAASEQMGKMFMPNMAVDMLKESKFSGNAPDAAQFLMNKMGIDGGRNLNGNRNLVKEKLEEGYSCIVRMNNGGHYSTVTKNENGQYIMKDSAYSVWNDDMKKVLSTPYDSIDELLTKIKYTPGDTFYIKS